ncbi:unnamed protein product [Gordionus sp. m RMFG-2023]
MEIGEIIPHLSFETNEIDFYDFKIHEILEINKILITIIKSQIKLTDVSCLKFSVLIPENISLNYEFDIELPLSMNTQVLCKCPYYHHDFKKLYVHEEAPYIFRPFIPNKDKHRSNNWIYNILNGKAIHEKIIYTTKSIPHKFGFILLQDMKWDGVSEKFSFIAVINDKITKNLRYLRQSHLPLLENLKICLNIISTILHMPKYKIIAFFRYPPKASHLQLFIESYAHHIPRHSYYLSEVIQNIHIKRNQQI